MRIPTNPAALGMPRHVNERAKATEDSTGKLASGKRVGGAKDDAAAMAVAEQLRAEEAGLRQMVRAANDAASMAQVADGALGEIGSMLGRMKELAVAADSAMLSGDQRAMLAGEVGALAGQIDDVVAATEFNGVPLLDATDGGRYNLEESLGVVSVNLRADVSVATGLALSETPGETVRAVNEAIDVVSAARAEIGSLQGQLERAAERWERRQEADLAARSRSEDADVPAQAAAATRNKIQQQAATAMAAQVNDMTAGGLELLL
jgi:flagellin